MSDETRSRYLSKIANERERQMTLFGSEWDGSKNPNDWVSTITHYVSEHITKQGIPPNKQDFEDSLVKAGAIIVAALEHIDRMVEKGKLRE